MKKLCINRVIVFFLLLMGATGSFATELNLSKASDNLDAFMRVRGGKPGEDIVFHWTGYVYSFIDGQRSSRLFDFEGFNIGRIEKDEHGYKLITREAAFYKDPKTGEILEAWDNPFNEKHVDVIQVWNDPVNQTLNYKSKWGETRLPVTDLDDEICFNMDLFLRYPSPLPVKEYPLNSDDDFYQASELFQFFAPKELLSNKDMLNVPCTISWTRISPWLPWMEMGQTPGKMVYQCRGRKLKGGYADLPQHVKDYVTKEKPEYAKAPSSYERPNETSWTYFKKVLDAKQADNNK